MSISSSKFPVYNGIQFVSYQLILHRITSLRHARMVVPPLHVSWKCFEIPAFLIKYAAFSAYEGGGGRLTFSSTQQPQKVISAFLLFFSNEWCLLSVCIGPAGKGITSLKRRHVAAARGGGTKPQPQRRACNIIHSHSRTCGKNSYNQPVWTSMIA